MLCRCLVVLVGVRLLAYVCYLIVCLFDLLVRLFVCSCVRAFVCSFVVCLFVRLFV